MNPRKIDFFLIHLLGFGGFGGFLPCMMDEFSKKDNLVLEADLSAAK